MIDLLEIGIENLIAYENSSMHQPALELLSQPDVLDLLYAGLHVEPARYGICQHNWCSRIDTLYNSSDSRSSWTGTDYCFGHTRGAMYNGIEARAQDIIDAIGMPDVAPAIVDIITSASNMRSLLIPTDSWPTIEPELRCGVCNDGIIEDVLGYRSMFAYDSNGTLHKVHASCSWSCGCCDTRYTNRPRMRQDNYIVDYMSTTYVSLTPDLGGMTQNWCATCVKTHEENTSLHTTNCIMCDTLVIGSIDEDITIYSEVHDEYVCQNCYDNGVDCDDCGYTMYNDSYHECQWDDDDDDDSSNDGIYNYTYKPSPIFHGDKPPFMGFELEVEASRSGNRLDGVVIMQSKDTQEKRWYLKHDGSLNYGFEIVTHPHNLDEYHKLDWSWLDALTNKGFRSWNTSSCGLHVHIGLDAFNDENHQIRFTKFIYDNERQVKRIAGRSSSYAAFDDKGKVIPKIKRKWQDTNRYSAVNVQNENTLEVRVFRGSLRKERVLSAIEFTHAACEYTRNMKVVPKQKPFSWLRFTAFVAANDDKYPNLFIIMNETFERAREIDQQEDGDNN